MSLIIVKTVSRLAKTINDRLTNSLRFQPEMTLGCRPGPSYFVVVPLSTNISKPQYTVDNTIRQWGHEVVCLCACRQPTLISTPSIRCASPFIASPGLTCKLCWRRPESLPLRECGWLQLNERETFKSYH